MPVAWEAWILSRQSTESPGGWCVLEWCPELQREPCDGRMWIALGYVLGVELTDNLSISEGPGLRFMS